MASATMEAMASDVLTCDQNRGRPVLSTMVGPKQVSFVRFVGCPSWYVIMGVTSMT